MINAEDAEVTRRSLKSHSQPIHVKINQKAQPLSS
jgi:hypothetical protein